MRLGATESFLVIGCGSIGQRHLRNLQALGVRSLLAVDPRADHREQAASETGAMVYSTYKQALDCKPSCVIVATPPAFHIPLALEAAHQGCHLLIEKPLSNTLSQIDELIEITGQQRLTTMVACNYRFDQGLNMLKALIEKGEIGEIVSVRSEFGFYLPQSHPYEDYRETYPSKETLGGGVLLDRTHEVDYLRWIFGKVQDAACYNTKRSHLEIETEDVAEIILRFESGVIASVHLDYIEREYRCKTRVIGDEGIIEWSYRPSHLRLYSAKSREWKVLLDESAVKFNDMYVAELQHFLCAVVDRTPTCFDLIEAKKLLGLILCLKQTGLYRASH